MQAFVVGRDRSILDRLFINVLKPVRRTARAAGRGNPHQRRDHGTGHGFKTNQRRALKATARRRQRNLHKNARSKT